MASPKQIYHPSHCLEPLLQVRLILYNAHLSIPIPDTHPFPNLLRWIHNMRTQDVYKKYSHK